MWSLLPVEVGDGEHLFLPLEQGEQGGGDDVYAREGTQSVGGAVLGDSLERGLEVEV